MELNINDIIAAQVNSLNTLFEKGAQLTKKEHRPFTTEDYDYLEGAQQYFGKYTLPCFLAYSAFKDAEYGISNPVSGTIWYCKADVNLDKTRQFLPIQYRLRYDTLEAYISLLKQEKWLHALIIFRSYIEYSSQLYACLLDYDFFRKYTENDVLDEEYKKTWFNSLRPEKVLSKIKGIHAEIDKLLKEKKIHYGSMMIYSQRFRPFDSELRGFLYKEISGLAHGSYPALTENDNLKLYSLIFLCSIYLIESQAVIDEVSSVYFNYSSRELFKKWVTIEIYLKSREPNTTLLATT